MNTCFKVFASYNILQYLCDFIHVFVFVTVSKCRKSPKLTNIVIVAYHVFIISPSESITLFRSKTMLCGTDNIPQNISHIHTECGEYSQSHKTLSWRQGSGDF
jgi:hypothetical protein